MSLILRLAAFASRQLFGLILPAGLAALLVGTSMCEADVTESTAGEQSVRLNTLGYLPSAPKRATIAVPCEEFAIIRVGDGEKVFEGTVSGPFINEDTEEDLFTADFSALEDPGEYSIEVDGVGRSPMFRIAEGLYERPFHAATRAMYLWRCGAAVQGEYDGQIFQHAPCHLDDGRLDFVGRPDEHRDATGGWHDAGDYNKYVANAAVTVGCMLRAWDDFGPRIEPVDLEIPESGGPLPDFLAELKWELDWLLKMQADDGSVYHKLSAAHYCGYVMPENESDPRYFGEWGSAATADFAAMMAATARYYRTYDPEFAARCLTAAQRSYEFLQANPVDHRPGQEGFQTGGYTSPDWDDRLWAAAELWETTGDTEALADFEARARSAIPISRRRWRNRDEDDTRRRNEFQWQFTADWDWSNVGNLALITYLFSNRTGKDKELVSQIRDSLLATADRIVAQGNGHGYGRPLSTRYYWGCNGTVARQVLVLYAANRVAPKSGYRETALDALNYLFGRNCHGRSYVTGLGHRPPLHPHDRRSAADDVEPPWPGYLVGGPERNARNWNDEQDDYRTNEIANNWNGALIYALAAAGDPW